MSDGISEAGRDRIEDICRRAGADGDVARELRGHLEDKVLAYVSGHERVTEADALILVERHFGDPAVVGRMLSYVHGDTPVTPSLWRRVLGAGIVAAGAGAVVNAGCAAVYSAQWHGMREVLATSCVGALVPAALWGLGAWWMRGARAGRGVWFGRAPVAGLVAMLVAAVLARNVALMFATWAVGPRGAMVGVNWQDPAVWWTLAITQAVFQAVTLAAWVWWCAWPGRGWRPAAAGVTAWWVLHKGPAMVGVWTAAMRGGGHFTVNDATRATGLFGIEAALVAMAGLAVYWAVAGRKAGRLLAS